MTITNNTPFVKTIKTAHFIFSSTVPFSLGEVLKNSFSGIEGIQEYMKVSVLPENVKIASGQKTGKSGAYWSHRITLDINEQNDTIRKQLNSYDNALVIICLEATNGHIYVYGNSDQPLSFTYKDVESTDNIQLIGHEIVVNGDTYGPSNTINTLDFYNPIALASWLATSL